MLFIVSKDITSSAKDSLRNYGEVLEFSSNGITYPEVSNHPDIFFCIADGHLIYAPNTPPSFVEELQAKNIKMIKGDTPVGIDYPSSAIYNAVVTEKYLIHKNLITDILIKKVSDKKELINVNQGYCRCSLLPLKDNRFITSDTGIYKKLLNEKIDVLLVNPHEIILPGADYGFFGGASGVIDDKVFIIGNLKYFPEGVKVREYITAAGYQIIELYDGPLYDGGSILIL